MADQESNRPRTWDADWIRTQERVLLAVARGVLGSEEAARDAVQEAWLRGWGQRGTPPKRWRRWLGRVTRHAALRTARTEQRRRDHESLLQDALGSTVEGQTEAADPHRNLELDELRGTLAETLASLADAQREIVRLRYDEGLSAKGIAERLDVSLGSVRGKLARAHDKIRADLERRTSGSAREWRSGLALLAGETSTPARMNSLGIHGDRAAPFEVPRAPGTPKGPSLEWLAALLGVGAFVFALRTGFLHWIWLRWTADAKPAESELSQTEPTETPGDPMLAPLMMSLMLNGPTHGMDLPSTTRIETEGSAERQGTPEDVRNDPEELLALHAKVRATLLVPIRPCLSDTCGHADHGPCAHCAELIDGQVSFRAFAERLVRRPKEWKIVGAPMLEDLRASETPAELREGWLNLAAYAPGEGTFAWLELAWEASPTSFQDGHLIAIVEAGGSAFRSRLQARAEAGSVRAAAYLLLQGDDEHAVVLGAAVEGGLEPREVFMAAGALGASGQEQAWGQALARVRTRVLELVDQESFEEARRMTVETEALVHMFGTEPRPGRYAEGGWWGFQRASPFWAYKPGAADLLGTELEFTVMARGTWEPTPGAIRSRIEALTGG